MTASVTILVALPLGYFLPGDLQRRSRGRWVVERPEPTIAIVPQRHEASAALP